MKKFIGFLCTIGSIFIISQYYQSPWIVFISLSIIISIIFFLSPKQDTWLAFISGAIIGPLTEFTCVYFGAWTYTNPNMGILPVWLPLIWGLGAIAFVKINRYYNVEER